MEINIKNTMKLLGVLVASMVLLACGGGSSSKPVKMVKVWKNVKEVSTRTLNGKVSSIITNTYDENGFLIKKEIDKDANGKIDAGVDSYIIYSYGSDGVLSKKTFYRPSGSESAERLIDEQGRDTENTFYDENGAISSTGLFVNTYDDKKRIIREEFSTNNDPVRGVIVFSYQGNIETHKYDTDVDGQTNFTFKLIRNDRGELVKEEQYNRNQELVSTKNYTYEYDENDNIITKTFSYPTNPTGEVLITYTWEERSVPESYAK